MVAKHQVIAVSALDAVRFTARVAVQNINISATKDHIARIVAVDGVAAAIGRLLSGDKIENVEVSVAGV